MPDWSVMAAGSRLQRLVVAAAVQVACQAPPALPTLLLPAQMPLPLVPPSPMLLTRVMLLLQAPPSPMPPTQVLPPQAPPSPVLPTQVLLLLLLLQAPPTLLYPTHMLPPQAPPSPMPPTQVLLLLLLLLQAPPTQIPLLRRGRAVAGGAGVPVAYAPFAAGSGRPGAPGNTSCNRVAASSGLQRPLAAGQIQGPGASRKGGGEGIQTGTCSSR